MEFLSATRETGVWFPANAQAKCMILAKNMNMRELIYILGRIYKAADVNRLKLKKKSHNTNYKL